MKKVSNISMFILFTILVMASCIKDTSIPVTNKNDLSASVQSTKGSSCGRIQQAEQTSLKQ